jgi:hypothetical protein
MSLIEFNVNEVDAQATARLVLFGGSEEESGTEHSLETSVSEPETSVSLLGVLLFLVGLGVAIWLGRRAI